MFAEPFRRDWLSLVSSTSVGQADRLGMGLHPPNRSRDQMVRGKAPLPRLVGATLNIARHSYRQADRYRDRLGIF